MFNPRRRRHSRLVLRSLAILALVVSLAFGASGHVARATGGQSFTFLQPGFTQAIFGVSTGFSGGVAFAPNGDAEVDACDFSGSGLTRYAVASTFVAHGTTLHAASVLPSNAGCGLTNHPDGTLYSNLSTGVVNLNPDTGAQLRGPFGSSGDALGITTDPQTGNLVYVGANGTIQSVNAAFTITNTVSTVTTGDFVDGIFFDPSGNFIFLADRLPVFRLTILRRDGTLVQHVPMTSEPDGIAFHSTAPQFVVSNNTDGTMTRFDFPGNDYTQPPTQTLFANGGFRGDLTQVGPDGCLYVTQDGTRYDDGTVTGENSLVQICPGFAPPAGVSTPTATATGTPPTSTPTPLITETETAQPTETETQVPETETPQPVETETPQPVETEIPQATETDTPQATETEVARTKTPTPTGTAHSGKPTPTQTPAPLTSTPTKTPPPATSTPSKTSTPVASITRSPCCGAYQRTVIVTGTNFGASEPVKIFWDSTTLALTSTTTTGAGGFVATFGVPQTPNGAHTIIAVGQSSGHSASAPFTAKAKNLLSHLFLVPGEQDVVKGTNFAAHETVKTYWNSTGPGGILLGSSTTNSLGTFTSGQAVTFTTPLSPTGVYNVISVGQSSGAVWSTPVLVVPTLMIAPTSGAHGSTATMAGVGYGAHETVTLKWNCSSPSCTSITVLGTVTTDGNGSFSGKSVTIPTAAVGSYSIDGLGGTSHAYANAHFNVTS